MEIGKVDRKIIASYNFRVQKSLNTARPKTNQEKLKSAKNLIIKKIKQFLFVIFNETYTNDSIQFELKTIRVLNNKRNSKLSSISVLLF